MIEYDEDLQRSISRIIDRDDWELHIAASIGDARLRALERPVDGPGSAGRLWHGVSA